MSFSVAWSAYQSNICNGLGALQQKGKFVDMTIAADGHHVKAHQMVLSLVSPYIGDLISSADCPHPVIFLNQVSYQTLESILQYAYTGEVMVARDKISEFLDACKALHIKGVEDLNTDGNVTDSLMDAQCYEKQKEVPKKSFTSKPPAETSSAGSDDDTMDSSYNVDQTPYHCGGSSPIPAKSKLNSRDIKALSDNMQYTVSNKGSLQLVCNRYIYFLMSSRKSGERMWRCMTYKRKCNCRAFLVTKDNRIIKRVGAHTHSFHDSQIMKRMNTGNMFSALKEVNEHVESMKNDSDATTSEESKNNVASVIITHDKNGRS